MEATPGGEECPICYGTFEESEKPHLLECGHLFLANCIITWFRSGCDTCPMCRGSPHVKMSPVDIMQRAKTIVDDYVLGNEQGYAQPLDHAIVHKIQQIKQLDTLMGIQINALNQEHVSFKMVGKKKKGEILSQYRKMRDEYRKASDPLLHELEKIDNNHRVALLTHRRSITAAKRERRSLMREVGLSGLSGLSPPPGLSTT